MKLRIDDPAVARTKKLRLGPEDLAVESFEVVAAEDAGAGTVHAAEYSENPFDSCLTGFCTCYFTCEGSETCDLSGCIGCEAG